MAPYFRRTIWCVLALALTGLLACTGLPRIDPQPVAFGEVPASPSGEFPNWPEKPERALELMTRGEVRPLEVKGAGSGTTGARKSTLAVSGTGERFDVKSKAVPKKLDGINNSPRKELAAWELQRLFLDPEDYTVPAATVRCVPLEMYTEFNPGSEPTIPGTSCVLVGASVWLENVTVPDVLFDAQRFLNEPRYAYHLANFNILSYLINLRDNRTGNVLVSTNDADRRVFAIDNGVAFGTAWFNWFYRPTFAWREIRVPALPRRTIERLRAIEASDLDKLAVILHLEPDEDGILWPVEPPGPPLDPEVGARREGTTVQFGLTDDEIEDIWERVEDLLEEVDDGEIPLF